jgi:hypothetical protein
MTTTVLFRIAAGVMALHVADDNFLQPNDGTSALDHLAGGLIPIALLVLAAWAYPRLRGSRQAAIALLLAPFGVVGGVEALHYAREVGASGDDFTGFASAAAGVVLLGLGAVTAWTTRRTHGSVPRRAGRRAAGALGFAVVLGVLVFPMVLGYAFTHVARAPVDVDLGPTAIDAKLRTSDGLDLDATYVPSGNGASVIVFPGRKTSQKHARMLMRHGYGVLIMDRRGEGTSDGDPNAFGWGGEKDISAGVDYLKARPDVRDDRIGGLGLSVGGELMIEHAAEHHGDLRAVVSEGAGTRQVSETAGMPDPNPLHLAVQGVLTASTGVFSSTSPPPVLRDVVDDVTPTPLFLVYAEDGPEGIEKKENRAYFRKASSPKRLWGVPTGGHMDGIDSEPRDYQLKITGFFDRSLLR